jgi:formylglycine-generating enzyme required for sulfatase activity
MGVPDIGNTDELPKNVPPHRVCIGKDFYLGIHEVTQAQYERIALKNPSWHRQLESASADRNDTSQLPVEQVSWLDAVEFCKQLSKVPGEAQEGRVYRLPTEAEWEYACRSGRSQAYHFSWTIKEDDKSGEAAGKNNRFQDRGVRTPLPLRPVGSYPPNEWGLFDMRGNVFEWCSDWFARDYYSRSPVLDPTGPQNGYLRVVRGCDWAFVTDHCKINRLVNEPFQKSPFIGFRLVCEYRKGN